MKNYPLLFTYRDVVQGKGFTSQVAGHGFVLLSIEPDEGFWMYGVIPGAIAAFGATPDEAHTSFRIAYREIINQIAEESSDFADFRSKAETFFTETNTPNRADWDEALALVRANNVTVEGLEKKPADSPSFHATVIDPRFQSACPPQFSSDPLKALAA